MKIEVPKPTTDGLRVDASFDDGVIVATFGGTADLETRADLEAIVEKLQEFAIREKPGSVVLDFRALEFMNSSSFKVFVTWFASIQDLPSDLQFKITLRSDPKVYWQRRSLAALGNFAADLVSIEAS